MKMADVHARNVILQVPPVPQNEGEIAFGGPAPYSNRFNVSVGAVVRIAFLEQEFGIKKPPHFRTAVTLSHQDAIELYQLLERLLKPVKEQLDALAAQEKKEGGDVL
jgi:hypothetical protein